MGLLEQIDSPEDVKHLSRTQLKTLAEEIRTSIVDVVSGSGGHLASSLGAVELAIALHYVFDCPQDKIIWDVGHQAYAHKLLTGRRKQFRTLRSHGGISGFTRFTESPYDAFSTGHSSTSISAGLGMVCGKWLKQDHAKVIAVIGDGSLTAGLAYEGLNQAGSFRDRDLIVILNDNDMSIARNVGALSSLLSRTFTKKRLLGLRKEFGEFLKSLPKIGDDMYQIAKRTEESFKTFVTPGMLFEAFNFEYYGPINGHNLDHLVEIFSNIKDVHEPVFLHVTTTKGKGYQPAEENPVYFHGCSHFDPTTGACLDPQSRVPAYTQVFGETLVDLAGEDETIVAVTAAMPEGTGLGSFAQRYPERFFDVGIAEQHGVTFAAGLATEGFKPVVAIYSTFLQRAYDQILHDVCLDAHHVVFAVDRGGIVGDDGPTHHGLFDCSYLRSLPNMVAMAPMNEAELQRMLRTALDHDGPIAFRYPRGAGVGVALNSEIRPLEIGRSEVLAEGDDLLILGLGHVVNAAVEARQILRKEGIKATVVNCRFLKPLDAARIGALAERIPRIVTVEENVLEGGFGSAVLECLADLGVTGFSIKRLGIPDRFIEHGPQGLLRRKYGIDAESIVEAGRALLHLETGVRRVQSA